MADFDFGEQAGAMNNFLGQAADQGVLAAYNAMNKIWGPAIAYDPERVIQANTAEAATANLPNVGCAAG